MIQKYKEQGKKILGILNLTPDSFSDGDSEVLKPGESLEKSQRIIAAGADILDIGAESTRPGATPIDNQEELKRLEGFFVNNLDLIDKEISIDTRNAEVLVSLLGKYPIARCILSVCPEPIA